MVGMQFALNVVTEDLGQQPYGNQGLTRHKVKVKCLGGCNSPERVVTAGSLKGGISTKCKECAHQTHGLTVGIDQSTKEGRALKHAIGRCHNPNDKDYHDYGQRGIYVCDEWRGPGGYEAFLAHIGPAPDKNAQLDRKNNETGSYIPGNVRWVTRKENCRNKRNNVLITIDGITLYQTDWEEISGVNNATISSRLKRGWSPKEAVFYKPHSKTLPSDTHLKLAFLKAGA